MNDRKPMVVGFTGTQAGMTWQQKHEVQQRIHIWKHHDRRDVRAIHGDCVGADADFDEICAKEGVPRECRPSNIKEKRANTGAREIAPPWPPLDRNKFIVFDATCMIACPKTMEEEMRSGTWMTIRFCRRMKRALLLVWPDGTVTTENGKRKRS